MQKIKLTKEIISEVRAYNKGSADEEIINNKKNWLNANFVLPALRGHSSIIMLHTQYGKSVVNKLIIDFILKNNPNAKILFVFPEIRLKEDGEELFDKRVKCSLPQGALKLHEVWDYLFVDEGQLFSNEDTIINSKIMDLPHKRSYINSAFLEPDQIAFFEKKGVTRIVEIEEKESILMGTIPLSKIYNIGVYLSKSENASYLGTNTRMNMVIKGLAPFYDANSAFVIMGAVGDDAKINAIAVKTGFGYGVIANMVRTYMGGLQVRKSILKKSQQKYPAMLSILNAHGEEKCIIYVADGNHAEEVKKIVDKEGRKSVIYTAKTGEYALSDFRKGYYNTIIIVNKGTVGKIDEKIKFAIHLAFESKAQKARQKKARVQTIDKEDANHQPTNYYIYMKSEEISQTQEQKWLKTAQQGLVNISDVSYPQLKSILSLKN